ncbi:class I SAM-dependent methyltransferase [Neptunicoccus sediminis]|uniref:class I SAM-dependent methyltransferase n=1 Tax=Neptunicoccus sediminis TaxID=1892596 RepID=UPI000845E519|nr:class I SAM-dependent methyltransferase [Neptunicoccus sediminis]
MSTVNRLTLPFDEGAIALPDSGQIVVLRAKTEGYGDFPRDRLTCVQGFYPTHQFLEASGYQTTTEYPDTAAMAIVHLTKAKDENRALLALAYDAVAQGGTLVVDGAKTEGIESLLKTVKKLHPVDGQLSKAHGKVFWLTKSAPANPFSDWAAALTPAPNKDGFMTAAGVFSADGIDQGSAELAPVIAGKLKGRVADLGAGWGWLAQQALSSNPEIESLDLIEAEHLALNCAKLNLNDPRARFVWDDAREVHAKRSYDAVISNPPFHTGRKAEPALGRAFIAAARDMLKPAGHLYLVANRQLAYEATLNECFGRVDVVNQSSRYKIIHARKPK